MRWLALLCLAACATTGSKLDTRELTRSVVHIQACGTGWLAREDIVVTNRHVAECVAERTKGRAIVEFSDGRVVRGAVYATAAGTYVDLALIRLAFTLGRSTLPLGASSELAVDDVLLSVGNPAPSRWVPSSYRVIAPPREVAGVRPGMIVLEGTATPGDSGSPVVTQDGVVVGVLFAASRGHAYAIPVEPYLVELLEAVPRPKGRFYQRPKVGRGR
jgi:serine protease Do